MSYLNDLKRRLCEDSPEFRAAYEAELEAERLERLRMILGQEEDPKSGVALVRLDAAARERAMKSPFLLVNLFAKPRKATPFSVPFNETRK